MRRAPHLRQFAHINFIHLRIGSRDLQHPFSRTTLVFLPTMAKWSGFEGHNASANQISNVCQNLCQPTQSIIEAHIAWYASVGSFSLPANRPPDVDRSGSNCAHGRMESGCLLPLCTVRIATPSTSASSSTVKAFFFERNWSASVIARGPGEVDNEATTIGNAEEAVTS
jgi:hypothetical protein